MSPLLSCGLIIYCGLIISVDAQHAGRLPLRSRLEADALTTDLAKEQCQRPIRPIDLRNALGTILNEEQAQVGVELGVQTGIFAEETLRQWSSNKKYYLVDVWAPLDNYLGVANVGKWPVVDGRTTIAIPCLATSRNVRCRTREAE